MHSFNYLCRRWSANSIIPLCQRVCVSTWKQRIPLKWSKVLLSFPIWSPLGYYRKDADRCDRCALCHTFPAADILSDRLMWNLHSLSGSSWDTRLLSASGLQASMQGGCLNLPRSHRGAAEALNEQETHAPSCTLITPQPPVPHTGLTGANETLMKLQTWLMFAGWRGAETAPRHRIRERQGSVFHRRKIIKNTILKRGKTASYVNSKCRVWWPFG